MTSRGAVRSLVAVSLLLGCGSAAAAPDDCLAYRDNPHVAACANQYGQQGVAPGPRTTHLAPASPAAPVPSADRGADPELKSVPVVVAVKTAPGDPAPAPETPMIAVDRQVLTNTVIVGAVAGSLLIVIALGAWRLGSTLRKTCPWCSSRINRSAHTCPRCFRAL